MPKVKYIEHDGNEHEVDVALGESLMQGAVNNMIEGIVAECGGACACATCHVYVDEAWAEKVGPPSDMEEDMLDLVDERKPYSRLSCQIDMAEELDGVVVRTPEDQG